MEFVGIVLTLVSGSANGEPALRKAQSAVEDREAADLAALRERIQALEQIDQQLAQEVPRLQQEWEQAVAALNVACASVRILGWDVHRMWRVFFLASTRATTFSFSSSRNPILSPNAEFRFHSVGPLRYDSVWWAKPLVEPVSPASAPKGPHRD